MKYYLLRGERNLSVGKAKQMAEETGTDPMVWLDPERAEERREAWAKLEERGGK